jgi:hypothetical protein
VGLGAHGLIKMASLRAVIPSETRNLLLVVFLSWETF